MYKVKRMLPIEANLDLSIFHYGSFFLFLSSGWSADASSHNLTFSLKIDNLAKDFLSRESFFSSKRSADQTNLVFH